MHHDAAQVRGMCVHTLLVVSSASTGIAMFHNQEGSTMQLTGVVNPALALRLLCV